MEGSECVTINKDKKNVKETSQDKPNECLESGEKSGNNQSNEMINNNNNNKCSDDTQNENSTPRKKTHWKSQSVSESTTKDSTSNFNQNRELWQRRAASQGQIDPPVTPRHNQELWELRQKHTPDLVMDLPFVGSPKDVLEKSIAEEETNSETNSPNPESPDMTTAERFAKQNQCTLKKKAANIQRNKNNGEIINETKTNEVESLSNFLNSEKIIQVKSELELVINPVTHQQRLTPKLPVKFATPITPPSLPSIKPQFKPKPQILKKPVLPVPTVTLSSHNDTSSDVVHKGPTPPSNNS